MTDKLFHLFIWLESRVDLDLEFLDLDLYPYLDVESRFSSNFFQGNG